MTAKKYKFGGKIEPAGMGGTFVFFPYDTEKEFGLKGKVAVKATFDSVAYTGSLMKCGFPQHTLHVPKAIRDQMGKGPGDILSVEVWKDDEQRTLKVPEESLKLLKKERLNEFFESLSYTHRKEYCRWVSEAKKQDTRGRRLEKAVMMLRAKVKTPG